MTSALCAVCVALSVCVCVLRWVQIHTTWVMRMVCDDNITFCSIRFFFLLYSWALRTVIIHNKRWRLTWDGSRTYLSAIYLSSLCRSLISLSNAFSLMTKKNHHCLNYSFLFDWISFVVEIVWFDSLRLAAGMRWRERERKTAIKNRVEWLRLLLNAYCVPFVGSDVFHLRSLILESELNLLVCLGYVCGTHVCVCVSQSKQNSAAKM